VLKNKNRFIQVVKSAFAIILLLNIILVVFFLFDDNKNDEIPLDYLFYVNLYGLTTSILFGYMDNPKLENKILLGLFVSAITILIISIFTGQKPLQNQSIFVLFGVVFGRKATTIIDMIMENNKTNV
jgi:hypothetical protein